MKYQYVILRYCNEIYKQRTRVIKWSEQRDRQQKNDVSNQMTGLHKVGESRHNILCWVCKFHESQC